MSEASRAAQRTMLLVTAGLVVLFWALDVTIVRGFVWETLLLRTGWALTFVYAGLRVARATERGAVALNLMTALSSALFYPAITLFTGGSLSPLFLWIACVPLAYSVFAQGHLPAVLLNALVTPVAASAVLLSEGAAAMTILIWWMLFAASGVMAIQGSFLFRRLRESELAAERSRALAEARAESMQRVADSERGRARAERMAVIGQLAAGVAHEVNNPLAYLRSNLRFLQQAAPSPGDPEMQEVFAECHHGLERITQIVTDLRTFAHDDEDQAQPSELKPLIDEAVRLASIRLRSVARVEVDVQERVPTVAIQRGRIVQVVVNLLVNAADALEQLTQSGATVRIGVRAKAGGVELTVEDNGPGIPDRILAQLFQPFATSKPRGRGTGLGLALCREYVERSGGRIAGENRQEGGARFTIWLPASAPAADEVGNVSNAA